MSSNYKFFNTSNSHSLGAEIAQRLQIPSGKLHSEKFSDGEVFVRFEESIRGQSLFILGQANMPYENLFELCMTVDAARRASAKEIICILPYLPHSRQERKDAERTSIAARVVADLLEQVGADRIMTMDLHSNSIEGFFKTPLDHLDASRIFVKHIKEHNTNIDDICLCSPDFGGLKRIRKYKKLLGCEVAVMHKERLKPNQVSKMEIIGTVKDKDVIIIDDMVDTAGTLCKAAEVLMEEGARSVTAYCTHGLLSGPALERIEKSTLKNLFITNTIANAPHEGKIQRINCAEAFALAIENLISNKSIKELNETFEM